METIRYVEDDWSLIDGLEYTLEASGYSADNARTVKQALALFNSKSYHLLLLDVTLPDGSGFEICNIFGHNTYKPWTIRRKIMSKRCPDCGFVNEDSRIYCGSCGEPLDAELRLLKDLSEQKKNAPIEDPAPSDAPKPASRRRSDGDDGYVPRKMAQEKKSSPLPWILLALGVILVVAGYLILSYAV